MRTNEQRFNRLVSVTLLRMSGVWAPSVALFANGSTFSQHLTTVCKPSDSQTSEDLRGSLRVGGPTSCRDCNIRALAGGLDKCVHERTTKKPLTLKPIIK